jgi:hypothetical protein
MKAQFYMAAIPLLAVVAFAQDPAPQSTTPPKPETKAAAPGAQDHPAAPAEMKTLNYSGTLTDATCATGGAATPAAAPSSTAAPNPAAPASATEKPKAAAGEANRATTADQGQACSVSASTTQFALKLKDGQVVKFDDVGNQRAIEALKSKKKWTDDAAAQKPIHATASGVLAGDRLTVLSIH